MIGGGTWEGAPMFDMRRMAGSGIGAPKGTPAEIVEKLNKEINAAISDPDMKARLADLGGIVLAGSSADFASSSPMKPKSGARS
jgi:tripartite-type tricarboxylate transporter receptor subunit TctC